MRFTVNAGEILDAKRKILNRGQVLSPAIGYPTVSLSDQQDELVSAQAANLGAGEYQAIVAVPVFDGVEGRELTLTWLLVDESGASFTVEDTVFVNESDPQVGQKEAVALDGDLSFSLELPRQISAASQIRVVIYDHRSTLTDILVTAGQRLVKPSSTVIKPVIPADTIPASLSPYNLVMTISEFAGDERMTSRLWMINPSILGHAQSLLTWIDKAQVKNVIPSLRYEIPDLLQALQSGLNKFNMLGNSLTSFNGMQMTGIVGEAWRICSCWSLLTAQHLAESNMAFDFQGQAVSASTDRTPGLDSLISRLETQMQDQVTHTKLLLAKSGITGGSGNMTGQSFSAMLGTVGLTRTPLTQYKRRGRR